MEMCRWLQNHLALELLNAIETRLKKKDCQDLIIVNHWRIWITLCQKNNGLTELKKIISERKLGSSKKTRLFIMRETMPRVFTL
jgi:hypothetical protein